MIRTEIIVEGNKLDTSADLEALLTFSIDDIKEFSSRNTKYSKTIVIPGTNQNNFVFGNLFDVNVYNSYDSGLDNVGYNYNAAKAAGCLVYMDRIQVFKGVIRILEITIVNGVVEYECAIFGELGGFIARVGDELLETLDFSAYNHTFNETNVQSSWSGTPGSGYYYPLIDYGYTTDGVNFDILNFRPALYAKEYLDKIMSDAGYSYTSTFLNSTEFKKLILPSNVDVGTVEVDTVFHRERPLVSFPSWPSISPGGTPHTITFNSSVGTQYASDSSGTITYSRNGNITVLVTGEARVYVANGDPLPIQTRLKIFKNGVSVGVEDMMETPGSDNATADLSVQAAVPLTTGDTLQLIIESEAGYTEIKYSACVFKADGQPVAKFALQYGDDLTIQGFIPKAVRRIDFFRSLVNMFNLYVTEDESIEKTLIITPFKDFYDQDLNNAKDWTYKLDHNKTIKVKPLGELNFKTYEFKYKDDVDYFNDLYKKKFSATYGLRKYDTGLEFVNDKKTVEVLFAPLVLRQYATTDRVLGCMFKQNASGVKEQYNAVPRIVYRAASNLSCGTWNLKNGSTTLVSPSDYPYAGHVDDPVDPTVDLCFGSPQELYYEADVYPVGNLFNVYWDFYVSEITDKDSKLLTAYFKLTATDILQLDFSKFIFIGGQLFRLNKIQDFNTLNPEVTKCELLNVIEIQ